MSLAKRIEQTGVLFVCMGNICRSPIAEGIFLHLAQASNVGDAFDVDSAGTGGWHAGERADMRARVAAQKHGVELPSRARQVNPKRDWTRFHFIIAMDHENCEHLFEIGAPRERVTLLRSFDPDLAGVRGQHLDVPDPYYGSESGFDAVFAMAEKACKGLLDHMLESRVNQ